MSHRACRPAHMSEKFDPKREIVGYRLRLATVGGRCISCHQLEAFGS